MKKIIYYVATSLDGFISGPNDDISGFVPGGNGVDKYLSDLKEFKTVIMGRKTYEFGYRFGLKPGQPAYPHMEHFIFSKTLKLSNADPSVHLLELTMGAIDDIRDRAETDIYLCGGGELAGWLLDRKQIDILKIKLNPLVLGTGTRLFGNSQMKFTPRLIDTEVYDQGLQIMTYQIQY